MSDNMQVLYIDDERANLDTVSKALSRQGYDVLIARNGQDGIDIAEREQPDLILLDILLPDMTGFEVCQQIRNNVDLKQTPIIGLTASTMDGDRRRILAAGFDSYLAKPIARLELINAIERLMDKN